jgi:hypothetical protein
VERRRQIECQERFVVSTPDDVRDDQTPAAEFTAIDSSDQEPNPDNKEKPIVITSQPPSYEEVTHGEPVVTSQCH